MNWYQQTVQDVLHAFETGNDGLLPGQVTEAEEEYGRNALPREKPKSLLGIFVAQFWNPLMVILIMAALASALFHEWLDVGVIAIAVLLNVLLGTVEEYKADQSLEQLKSFLPQQARVRRGGKERVIDSVDIVPGDRLLLSAGDKITADARLVKANNVLVDEAPLTGESTEVEKQMEPLTGQVAVAEQVNMVFAGTTFTAGVAEAIVVRTGVHTEIGTISHLVANVEEEETPLQKQLRLFAMFLGGAVILLSLVVFLIGIVNGVETVEMMRIAIALAVSAIPEGLVIALTIILAVGMQRILKRQALVRKLVAAETLGSVSVICTDKTGTLTTGQMSVAVHGGNEEALKEAILLTQAVHMEREGDDVRLSGSPTEIGLMNFAWNAERFDGLQETSSVVDDLPFDSKRKFKARLVQRGSRKELFVIGAPDVLFERLDVSDAELQRVREEVEAQASQGLRLLLLCRRDEVDAANEQTARDLHVLGWVGLRDPLRKDAKETIEQAVAAGIRPVMITGDHPETAFRIAQEAGLVSRADEIVTGAELDTLDDEAFARRLRTISVYARVLPKHKLRIIDAWQKTGASVAMVGDGVNDAPAIKGADIGVALGSGTEVTKQAADMVLLDGRFQTIVAAVKEGRVMFENIRKTVVYLLSDSFSEIILILGALLFALPMPILPAQILWINLVKDGFASIALAFEPAEDGVMNDPPRSKKEPLLNSEMKALIIIIGITTNVLLLSLFFYLLGQSLPIEYIRTFVFIALGLDSLVYVFAVRTLRVNIFHSKPFANTWLLGGNVLGLISLAIPVTIPFLQEVFGFVDIGWFEWTVAACMSIVNLMMIELVKAFYAHKVIKKKSV
jgi:Ca2+-transporting ATPase